MNLEKCETTAINKHATTGNELQNHLRREGSCGHGAHRPAGALETGVRYGKTAADCRNPRRKRSTAISENLLRLGVLAFVLLSLAATSAHACGPFFPNNLLDRGDEALLSAPIADFHRELARLNLAPSRFAAVSATNSHKAQAFDAEMADLAAALKQSKVSPEETARIVEGHRVNRKKLDAYLDAYDRWDASSGTSADASAPETRGAQPGFPSFEAVPDLPGEFADYFAGAAALRNPSAGNSFREPWERLLARPAAERKYKSTWAAFMLGRTAAPAEDDQAIEYFQKTRALAQRGFADSIGLAAASLGWEAQVELRRRHFKRALELYLDQHLTGDDSALQSLRIAAHQAMAEGGEELSALAASPNLRAVITAYLISDRSDADYPTGEPPADAPLTRWLNAVEAAGVKDVDSVERFALAAYQAGEFERAQRWINRARNAPVAMWVQAKLWLRAGKISQAAALLTRVTSQLPITTDTESADSNQLADSLRMESGGYDDGLANSARKQMLGELGGLRLSRQEFTPALEALLQAGFWMDAAYVAERVLTTDELKDYVNRNWPPDEAPTPTPTPPDAEIQPPDSRRENIRYLLARRLTRELRSGEAREYFPGSLQARFDELVVALNAGWNERSPAAQRAQALFTAAKIARADGMELLGTELAPDWHVYNGGFEEGVTWEARATNAVATKVNVASAEEIQRATRHGTDPNVRFHYRHQAAFLGWAAAKLMPDNADETARVLCTAGSWLKHRDPATADIFYKALVRRCRQTATGAQADRMRWFPVLDAAGNPKPYRSRLEEMTPPSATEESAEPPPKPVPTTDNGEMATTTYPLPGQPYIIHSGDSIAAIANAVSRLGQPLTAREILEANPDLDPSRLQVGQKIFIPVSGMQSKTDGVNAGWQSEN